MTARAGGVADEPARADLDHLPTFEVEHHRHVGLALVMGAEAGRSADITPP